MSEERKELWTVLYDTEPDALCMVSEAARLSREKDLVCRTWLLCSEMKQDDAMRLAKAGAQKVTHLHVPQLDCNVERAVRDYMVDAAEKEKPAVILFLSTVLKEKFPVSGLKSRRWTPSVKFWNISVPARRWI